MGDSMFPGYLCVAASFYSCDLTLNRGVYVVLFITSTKGWQHLLWKNEHSVSATASSSFRPMKIR